MERGLADILIAANRSKGGIGDNEMNGKLTHEVIRSNECNTSSLVRREEGLSCLGNGLSNHNQEGSHVNILGRACLFHDTFKTLLYIYTNSYIVSCYLSLW